MHGITSGRARSVTSDTGSTLVSLKHQQFLTQNEVYFWLVDTTSGFGHAARPGSSHSPTVIRRLRCKATTMWALLGELEMLLTRLGAIDWSTSTLPMHAITERQKALNWDRSELKHPMQF